MTGNPTTPCYPGSRRTAHLGRSNECSLEAKLEELPPPERGGQWALQWPEGHPPPRRMRGRGIPIAGGLRQGRWSVLDAERGTRIGTAHPAGRQGPRDPSAASATPRPEAISSVLSSPRFPTR